MNFETPLAASIKDDWLLGRYIAVTEKLLRAPASAQRSIWLATVSNRRGKYEESLVIVKRAEEANLIQTKNEHFTVALKQASANGRLRRAELAKMALGRASPLISSRADEADFLRVTMFAAATPEASAKILAEANAYLARPDELSSQFIAETSFAVALSQHARGRIDDAVTSCLNTLQVLLRRDERDHGLIAGILYLLGALDRRGYLRKSRALVYSAVDEISWSPELNWIRATVLASNARHKMREGNYVSALRELNRCRISAGASLFAFEASLARAEIALLLHEPYSLQAELADIEELARFSGDIPVYSEHVDMLQNAAEIFALVEPAKAFDFLDMAKMQRLDGMRETFFELKAFQQARHAYVEALLARTSGRRAAASRKAALAFDGFLAIEEHWYAARSADLTYQMTGDSQWLRRAQLEASWFPQSDLAKRLCSSNASHIRALERLTKRQRDVLLHLKGESTAREISDKLGISYPTVCTHISSIYRIFGVRSRMQLMSIIKEEPL